jgi:Caspase domain
MKKPLLFLATSFFIVGLQQYAQAQSANRVKFKITTELSKPVFLDTEKKIFPPVFSYAADTKNDLTVTDAKYTVNFRVTAKDLKKEHRDQFKVLLNNKPVAFECLEDGENKMVLRAHLALQNGFNIIFATGKNETGESKSEWHTVNFNPPVEGAITDAPNPVERRLALIIGNQDYTNIKKLANPVNDANAMKSALENLGFDVLLAKDMTKAQLQILVRTYCEKLKSYDVGLVYYAGHGIETNGINYIVPVEVTKTMQDVDVPYECLETNWIQKSMLADAKGKNKTNIFIVDACRNNPFSENKDIYKEGRMFVNAEATVFNKEDKPGMITAFATSQDQISMDNTSGNNGLYTSVLLKYIQEPGLAIETVFTKIRGDERMQKAKQNPVETNHLTKIFYFKKLEDKKN